MLEGKVRLRLSLVSLSVYVCLLYNYWLIILLSNIIENVFTMTHQNWLYLHLSIFQKKWNNFRVETLCWTYPQLIKQHFLSIIPLNSQCLLPKSQNNCEKLNCVVQNNIQTDNVTTQNLIQDKKHNIYNKNYITWQHKIGIESMWVYNL